MPYNTIGGKLLYHTIPLEANYYTIQYHWRQVINGKCVDLLRCILSLSYIIFKLNLLFVKMAVLYSKLNY